MLDAKLLKSRSLMYTRDSLPGPLIIGTVEKRAPGAEMRAAIVSGMVTRDAPVSYWPIFFRVPSNSPRSLCKS